MGRNVRTVSMEPSKEMTLDVTELASGIYFVEVMDERGGRSVQQLVVEGSN
jgi:hypothetical protein